MDRPVDHAHCGHAF